MKRTFFIPIMVFIMLSCAKEKNNPSSELNISLKSTKSLGDLGNDLNVVFYPNPFKGYVMVNISGADSASLLISNDSGGMKKITLKGMGELDFSKEKQGTYYCEVLINKTVFRTYLINN